MNRREVSAWVRVRRLGQRLKLRVSSWLLRAGRFFRFPAEWLPAGTECRRAGDREIRVLGPLPRRPEISDRDVLARLQELAPDAGDEQHQSWLAGLTANRDQGREVFPLDDRELPLAGTAGSHWLHRVELDRQPSSSYLEARFGGTASAAEEPADLLIEGRPAERPPESSRTVS